MTLSKLANPIQQSQLMGFLKVIFPQKNFLKIPILILHIKNLL